MSDIATCPSRVHRIRYTPMRDVLRGRFTGRLDFRRHIAESGLPQPARQLIQRVVRRTRLRVLEKADVTNELIAHFADGLESGKTIEQLIASFGDEHRVARLIARAKRRNRSVFGRAQTIVARAMVLVIAMYVLTGVYFFSGCPSSTPRFEMLNNFARQYPESQRAWSIYDRGFHERWGMKQIGEASTRPVIGYIADASSVDKRPADGNESDLDQWPTGECFTAMRWVGLSVMRDMGQARVLSDQARWMSDFDTAINLCRQWHADPAIQSEFFEVNLFNPLMSEICQVTTERPSLLSDEQFRHIENSIVSFRVAADLVNPESEEARFDDWLNRTYTSGGLFPSRITPAGLEDRDVIADHVDPITRAVGPGTTRYLLEPLLFLATPSRATLVSRFSEAMKQSQINLALPRRSTDWSGERIPWASAQLYVRFPFFFQLHELGMVRNTMAVDADFAEYALGNRDGALIGVAAELYQRQHHQYPASLDELYPVFVTEKIVDRITGEPLHYRIVDGRPLVYSVGGDRKDDGGRVPRDYHNHLPDPQAAAIGNADGDWVIYPLPKAMGWE